MQLGNPSNATADTNNHSHYLILRPVEAMDYNDARGLPNWASWNLTTNDLGSISRSTSFFVDTNLPGNFYTVGTTAYSGSGYDRGHLCPSADRTATTNDNQMVFLMSNMMPQASDNNSGVWGNFEGYCRSLCQSSNNYELLIICGPSGFTGAKINTNGYVWIPQYTWKIVVVVPPGPGLAVNRITATNRVIAIKVPNTNGVSSVWQDFVTSANQIQVDTGFTFFTALPSGVASVLRSKVDGQTNAPPEIFGFSPSEGSAATNVTITGTNFVSATEVTFGGIAATFTVDSPTQITAIVPDNGSSGAISVTTPGGTAISSGIFVVAGGVSVFNGVLAGWDVSTETNFGGSPLAATTISSNLTVVGLARGSGVSTGGSAATRAWGGSGFTGTNVTAAAVAGEFATLGIAANTGCTLSFASISQFNYRRSSTGPTNGVLQYRLGDGAFVDIANLNYDSSSSSGSSLGPIDLSGVAALQNIGAGTNVTFRIINYSGGSSGNWYVYDKGGSSAPDLAFTGTITWRPNSITQPVAPPVLSAISRLNNLCQFTVTGTVGSNYVVQAATSLTAPAWVSLATNPAPFVFIETNANNFGQRFYRGVAAQ